MAMKDETRWAGAIFILSLVGVMFGGSVMLYKLAGDPNHLGTLHQDLWRAGHAHAGVFLIVTLVILPWIDAARLSNAARWYVRVAVSSASITFPLAFFLAVPNASVTETGPLLSLIYPGAALLATGLLVLAWGLMRGEAED
jgi:hypothetical protein